MEQGERKQALQRVRCLGWLHMSCESVFVPKSELHASRDLECQKPEALRVKVTWPQVSSHTHRLPTGATVPSAHPK